jgi:EF-P beta-lysylation protein EpmB
MPALFEKRARMIPASSQHSHPATGSHTAGVITDPAELLDALDLPADLLPAARRAAQRFGLRVPRHFVARMRPGDVADPLLRQVLPLDAELERTAGFDGDPVGDLASSRSPGLLQKYAGRALLVSTGACDVHCRFCFRREFPYDQQLATGARLEAALAEVAADPDIGEVILSGGDPLVLSPRRLRAIVTSIAAIPHVERLRVHTRQPIVAPEQVGGDLLEAFAGARPGLVMVVHANHPREVDADVSRALGRCAVRGFTLLNQTVLLRGVNDDIATLAALSERLFACGVLPYYLHQLDRVSGAAHFAVPDPEALRLHAALLERLPGYLVPRLVREVAGAKSKTPVSGRAR